MLPAGAVSVGTSADPDACGPRLFGADDRTANRTRPCWPMLFTLGNSPPSTTYSLVPVTLQAAWVWPV